MNHAKQLQAIIKTSGWSQETLASRLGVSFVTLNAWLNDRSQPRPAAVEQIRSLYFEIVGTDELDIAALAEAKVQAGRLKTSVRAIVRDQAVLGRLTLHLTYHTNTIEGSTMTLADTEAVLFEYEVLTNRTQVEQLEARNHQAALLWLLQELQAPDFRVNEDLILGLHTRLMNGILSDAGRYRRHGVRIMGSHVTVANYAKVPELVMQLAEALNDRPADPIASLAAGHAQFEKIHPFSDGNGRIGRLLLLAQALQLGLVPPLVLRERRQAYYKYLELAQSQEKPLPLELFIAESMLEASRVLFSR